MSKRILIMSCIFCILGYALAYGSEKSKEELNKTILEKVIEVATKYAESISCVEIPPSAENVIELIPYIDINDIDVDENESRESYNNDNEVTIDDGKYAVFWAGDVGCYGGSGTVSFNVAIVRVNITNGAIYVDPLKSSPIITLDFPTNGFKRVVYHSKDIIVIEGAEHGPNDPRCCPSKKYLYTLQIEEDSGNWILIKREPIINKKHIK